jgi:hypothetical protein
MASTFSNLGLNLQATGENSGTWGTITNVNLQDIDNAISGVYNLTITGSTTLAFTTNSSSTTFTDESGRNKTIILSGALSATTVTITVPNIEKDYYIVNNSGATTIISSGGSTTVSIATGSKGIVIVNPSVTSVISALPTDQVNSPGGTSTNVQYNLSGAFAGSSVFTFDGTSLSVPAVTATSTVYGATLVGASVTVSGTATATNFVGTNVTVSGNITGSTVFAANVTVSGTVTAANLIATNATVTNLVMSSTANILSQSAIRFQDTTGGEYVALRAPGTVSASYTLSLPSADGTNGQAILTNGSGTLSFGNAGITAGKSIALTLVFG